MITEPKKVLIVKLNKLGDTVAFLPAIEAIRKSWPKARLTFLTTDIGKELVESSRLVDEIWISGIDELKNLYDFLQWLRIIRKNRFDVAIASSDSSSFVALMFFLSSIPVKVGFTNPRLSFLFNIKIPFSKSITHSELNLLVAKRLGLTAFHKRPQIDISIKEDDKRKILERLDHSGIATGNPFIALHVCSNRPSHRWSAARYTEVCNFLAEKYSMKIVCVGGKQEKELVSSFPAFAKEKYIVDMCCETNVKQLIYLISLANLFIGHSSGPLHIAYMVGTPTVSLWGASSLSVWGPPWEKEKHICVKADLNCLHCEQKVCPKGTLECMKQITVEMVIKGISELLEKHTVRVS